MKKSKWKRSQIVRPAPSKEKTFNIQQKKPQIYEQFINHKIMDDITIDLIKAKIKLIREELDWIEKLIDSPQIGRGSFYANTTQNFDPAIPGVDYDNKNSIEKGTKLV